MLLGEAVDMASARTETYNITARKIVEQISAIFWPNRSNCDTSMTFGRNIPLGSLCKKKVLATWIFNMAAIFFKTAARV